MKKVYALLAAAFIAGGLAGCSDHQVGKHQGNNEKIEKLDSYHKLKKATKSSEEIIIEYSDPNSEFYTRNHFKDAIIDNNGDIVFSGFNIKSGYEGEDLYYEVFEYRVKPNQKVSLKHTNFDAMTHKKIKGTAHQGELGKNVNASTD